MKKIIVSIVLCVAALVSLAGCGSKTVESSANKTAVDESVPGLVASTAITEGNVDNETDSSNSDVDFQTTVFDSDVVSIDVLKARTNKSGYMWDIEVVNKTSTAIFLSFDDVAINGVLCEPYWGEAIAAGETLTSTVKWDHSALEAAGVEDVTAVQLTASAWDCEDYTDVLQDTIINVYPRGVENAVLTVYDPSSENGSPAFETDDFAMYVTAAETDEFSGFAISGVLTNGTEDSIMLESNNVKINGIELDPYWSEVVPAGSLAYTSIHFSSAALSEADLEIDNIETIEMTLSVYEGSSWAIGTKTDFTFTLTLSSTGFDVS